MNELRGQAPARQVRRGIAVVLTALLVPPGTLLLRAVPALDLVLLALGCLGLGFLMLAHGLVTPGIGGRPVNLWVGRLPVLAIATFAACLAAAAWPQRPPATWAGRRPAGTLAAGGLTLTLVLVAVSLWPATGPAGRPVDGEEAVRLALVLGAALVLVAVGAVHWHRWRLGLDRMQLALVVACLLSAGALLSLQLGRPWHLAWWDYHAFLLTGFAAAIYAVLTGYRRSAPSMTCSTGCSPATHGPHQPRLLGDPAGADRRRRGA
jgi:hypothetical protein